MPDHAASSTTTQIAQNSVFERFACAGYVVSGLLHLTIGYLAIRSENDERVPSTSTRRDARAG